MPYGPGFAGLCHFGGSGYQNGILGRMAIDVLITLLYHPGIGTIPNWVGKCFVLFCNRILAVYVSLPHQK
jgi:hypothetical protein